MFDFLTSCTLLACDNNITTNVNIIPNHQLMLQLVYGLDTYDHDMCAFSLPIKCETFNLLATNFNYDSH